MGCGCGGKSKVTPSLPRNGAQAPQQTQAQTYDIFSSGGTLVASTTNIVFARVEARRTGGTVVPREVVSQSQSVV